MNADAGDAVRSRTVPGMGYVRTSAAQGLEACVRSLGGDLDAVLHHAGTERQALADPQGVMSLSCFTALLEAAAAVTRCPVFGSVYAAGFDIRRLGPLGYLLFHGRTLGDGLADYASRFGSLQSHTEVELGISGDVAWMSYRIVDGGSYPRVQDAIFSMAILMMFGQRLAGQAWRCLGVGFEHHRGSFSHETELLGAPVSFGETSNLFRFPVSLLDHPNPQADPLLTRHLRDTLRDQIAGSQAARERQAAVMAAMEAVLEHDEGLSLGRLAAELGWSVRSLQRRLDDLGTSFSQLYGTLRLVRAETLLTTTTLAVTTIALMAGYSETSAFSRAFKRTTGLTPLACRHLGRSNLAKRRSQRSPHGTEDRPYAGPATLHPLAQPMLDT